MLREYFLNLEKELDYAQKWALSRNPAYYNFDDIGGDCTNFVSQCLPQRIQAGITIPCMTAQRLGRVSGISGSLV